MRAAQIIVRASIGMCLFAAPAWAQGVRLAERGGVRIGSPSNAAMSRNTQIRSSAVLGGNTFYRGSSRRYIDSPYAIHGDSVRIDGRFFDDEVSVHFGDRTGFSARGSFHDDDFSLRFRLGGLHNHLAFGHLHTTQRYGHYRRYRPYSYGLPYNYYYYDEPGYPIGYVSQPAPTPPPPPPAAVSDPQTPLEVGIGHLWRGEFQMAIRVLSGVIATDDSQADAQRMLALALIAKGRLADGVAMMRSAYDNDPALAREPVEVLILGPESEEILAQLVRKSSLFANRVDSASAWLTLAALMQAQGRDERAGKMLGRAIEAGLDRKRAEAFGLQLPPAKPAAP